MTDDIDDLLTRAFANAERTAVNPALVEAVLARLSRRARIRAAALGVAGLAAALAVSMLVLPAVYRLDDLITQFAATVQIGAPALLVFVVAATSPWLVAMVDDRV